MGDDFVINDINDRWYHYRSIMGVPSRRRIFCGIGWIVSVLSLIFFVFLFMAVNSNPVRNKAKDDTNSSSQEYSMRVYESFPSALNLSVDPCVDFYKFSCDLWAKNNPIPTYDARVTTFSVLQDIVSKKKKSIFKSMKVDQDLPRVVNSAIEFYNACVELDNTKYSIRPLLNHYFNEIGGWPILNPNEWNETLFDWYSASAFLIKHMDLHTVIGIYSTDDDKSGSRNVIYLKQPSILEDKQHTLNNAASLQMLYVILKVLNDNHININTSENIRNLGEVETRWRQLLSVPKKLSDPLNLSIAELSKKIPAIDWLKYLQLITNDTLLELNMPLTMNDTVVVENIDFLYKVSNVVTSNTFSNTDLANLFGWFVVKDIWVLIPGVLQEYAIANGYSTDDMKSAASNQCFDLVTETFSSSLDYLYVMNSTHEGNKDGKVLIKYLKSAFKDIVENSQWIDDKTKASVLYRINSMQYIIGFPDYLKNKTEFDKVFESFPVITYNIVKYYLNIQEYYSKIRILSFRIPNNSTNWLLPRSVTDVSSYYIVFKNTLVYPISLHNPPFYYLNGPQYLNFGAIGSVIGHEMMHGFDNYGSQGNNLNATWLSKESREVYLEQAECFKLQYDKFDSNGVYRNNGTCTLRENIADNEGLHIAFNAYKKYTKDFGGEENYRILKSYSPYQMFYIAYANVWCSEISPSLRKPTRTGTHSFPDIRVNKAVSNSKSFAVAFNCPEGSPMNPVKKCSIW